MSWCFFAARGSTHLSPNIISRDYTGDHRSWWRTTHGWVGKRGSQELWTRSRCCWCSFPWSIGVARKCASIVCVNRRHRLQVTCASCTSVCYTSPAHPMHYACSCTAPTQEQEKLPSCCFTQLSLLAAVFASLCSAPSFLLICAHIVLLRCSRRLPRMRVSRVHLRCLHRVFSSNVNSETCPE